MATKPLSLAKQLGLFVGMATRLGPFLRDRLTPERCTETSRRGLARREESFLELLDRALARDERHPYSRLLRHAGITLRDVGEGVRARGLEPTLAMLHDHGVYVTLDEFKGRVPIRRGSLVVDVGSHGCYQRRRPRRNRPDPPPHGGL